MADLPVLLAAVSLVSLVAWLAFRPRRARHAAAHRPVPPGRPGCLRLPGRTRHSPLGALIDATWEPRPAGQKATLSCGCVVWYLPYGEALVTKCRHHKYMESPDFAVWTVEMGRRSRDRRG